MADPTVGGDGDVPANAHPSFTCAECGGEFEKEWSDEESLEEARVNGFDPDNEETVVVCDDCYRKIMEVDPLFGYARPPGRPWI